MYNALLTAGLALESVKHTSVTSYHKAAEWLDMTATALDNKYGEPYPCSGNFMCLRETVRHKSGCPGKTVPIEQYVRALQ